MNKQKFLAVYDYGQGGVWAMIIAHNQSEIEQKYPGLRLYSTKPEFLSQGSYDNIVKHMTIDIDDEPVGWLAEYLKERPR